MQSPIKKSRISSNRKLGHYEDWEIDFIRLAYPLSNGSEIAKILNRSTAGLNKTIKGYGINKEIIDIKPKMRFGKLIIKEQIKTKRGIAWKCVCGGDITSYPYQLYEVDTQSRLFYRFM